MAVVTKWSPSAFVWSDSETRTLSKVSVRTLATRKMKTASPESCAFCRNLDVNLKPFQMATNALNAYEFCKYNKGLVEEGIIGG
jgi:hypothetical protein